MTYNFITNDGGVISVMLLYLVKFVSMIFKYMLFLCLWDVNYFGILMRFVIYIRFLFSYMCASQVLSDLFRF